MKIQTIEVFVFKYDHHYRIGGHNDAPNRLAGTDYYFEPQWQHVYSRQTESCLVKITTEEGIEGWGEAQAPVVPEVAATLIARLMGPAIIGMDAQDTDAVYERLYHLNHVRGHTASFTIDAIAALDIALWDIKGKAAAKTVARLIGEPKTQLPLYVSGLRRGSREERKDLAKEVVTEGYTGVKIFFGNTAEETLQECAAIRESIGGHGLLAFDAICRHHFDSALQIGRGLDELNAAWFESPLDPEDVEAHACLAESIQTPLAVGEPLRTVREFKPWLDKKAMQIAQPDVVRCGITGGLRIIDAAQKEGLQVAPHIGVCTAIGMAATWHVSAVLADVPQEHQLDMFPVANKILKQPLDVKNGRAIVPHQPGLGIDINEEFVKSNSTDQWRIDAKGIVYRSGKL